MSDAWATPPADVNCLLCGRGIYPNWRAEQWLHMHGSSLCSEAALDDAELGTTSSDSGRA